MKAKHYYKVVRRLASPLRKGTGLYSMYAQGSLRKEYHEGKWSFAKLKHLLRGFGFLVYTNKIRALSAADNSLTPATLEVWEVRVLGKVQLPRMRLEIGSSTGSYVTEEHLQILIEGTKKLGFTGLDLCNFWPSSTIACAGVKLLHRVDS